MSQDNQFNFYLGASHDKRKTVNQQVKNFVLNDAFWIRYDQERSYKQKSKIAEEVLDFVYEMEGVFIVTIKVERLMKLSKKII